MTTDESIKTVRDGVALVGEILKETLINSRAAAFNVTKSRHCKALSLGIRN